MARSQLRWQERPTVLSGFRATHAAESAPVPTWRSVAATLLLLAVCSSVAVAQDHGTAGWSFRLAPYLWFSNVGGAEDLGRQPAEQVVGNLIVPVEDTALTKAWAVRAELGKGRIRGWLNVSRATLATAAEVHLRSDPSTASDAVLDFSWYTTEMFGAVQVGSLATTNSVELYGGARYTRQSQTVTLDGRRPRHTTERWIDAVGGVRLYVETGRRFWAAFNTDIGGFGAGTEFSWTLGGELGVRLTEFLDLTMRYHYQEIDFDNGRTGLRAYRWSNGVQQGWLFGAVLKL